MLPFHCSVFAEFAVPGLSPAKTKVLVLVPKLVPAQCLLASFKSANSVQEDPFQLSLAAVAEEAGSPPVAKAAVFVCPAPAR